jgi:hypothetical protein
MRRLIPVATFFTLFALVSMHPATAEPRVLPPLDVQIVVTTYLDIPDQADTAVLQVDGTQCVPLDAPASVLVTVDRLPDKVFTATPRAGGGWYINIDIPVPVDGVYVVNAECDNYFGATPYPQAEAGPDDVVVLTVLATSAGSGESGGGVANTGTRTRTEIEAGLAALAVGAFLVWAGRARRGTSDE